MSALAGEQPEPESADTEEAQTAGPATEPSPDADKLASLVEGEGSAATAEPPPLETPEAETTATERGAQASERLRGLLSGEGKQKDS